MAGYAERTTLGGGKRVGSRLTHQEEEIINVSFQAFATQTVEGDEKREIIDVYKLVEAFQSIDASSDIEDIKLLIADIDENGDADIDLAEWRHIMSRKFLGEEDDSSFTHVFSMLDDDKDGHIPLVEFRKMLMEEGQAPLSEQEVDELLMFADTDSDGLINYRKFLKWLSSPEGYHKDVKEQNAAINDNRQLLTANQKDRGSGVGVVDAAVPKAGAAAPAAVPKAPVASPPVSTPQPPISTGAPKAAPPTGSTPSSASPPAASGAKAPAAAPGAKAAAAAPKGAQPKGLMQRPVAKGGASAKAPAGLMPRPGSAGAGS